MALILVDAGGENSIAVAGGANAALGSVQVRTALKRLALTRDDVVLVGHEIRTGATHEALRLGRIAGATTILNPAPATGLEPPTLALADLLTPNRGELAALAGADGRASVAGQAPARRRSLGFARRWSASARTARSWSRPAGHARSTRHTSSPSTRSGPATRSTGRWRRRWRPGSISRSRLAAPSSPRRWRSPARAPARGCRRWPSSRRRWPAESPSALRDRHLQGARPSAAEPARLGREQRAPARTSASRRGRSTPPRRR